MPTGYWFMLGGLVSFAAMGVIHKLGDRQQCNALNIALFTMATSCVFSLIFTAISQRGSLSSWNFSVPLIAIPFGAAAAVALWLFQRGLRYGRIATSWLLINLSAGVPTVLSVVVYHESLSLRKTLVLLLIVLSLALLWWDRKQDMDKAQTGDMLPVPGSVGEVD
jgi:drug/metabolite transporter (DMT)-like permease